MRLWILFAMMMTASTATALDFTFENIDGGRAILIGLQRASNFSCKYGKQMWFHWSVERAAKASRNL